MRRRKPLEKSIERTFVRKAEALGCRTLKLNVMGRRSWHDRLVLLPNGRKELFEFKRPGGKLTPGQTALHEELRAMGHTSYVFDSWQDAMVVLAKMLNGYVVSVRYPTAKRAATEAELYEKIVGRASAVIGRKKK